VDMEKKGPEIPASSADEGRPEQHAIDVGRGEQGGDAKGEDVAAEGKERVVVAEEVQSKKKSKRVAALDAFRGLTIVVHIHSSVHVSLCGLNFENFPVTL
jgi:heparan-alpha-glucosaminide N-acetyltransferase